MPDTFSSFLHLMFGVLLLLLGISYAYKFFQASFLGKVSYWSGLDNLGWYFIPFSTFVTPWLCHGKPNDKSLIKWKNAWWIHLFWSPIFFLASLLCLTVGADSCGLPGSAMMNTVLTFGNHHVPPAITYEPPFTYKFPVLKKAGNMFLRAITTDIPEDKSKRPIPPEQQAQDLGSKPTFANDDDEDEASDKKKENRPVTH